MESSCEEFGSWKFGEFNGFHIVMVAEVGYPPECVCRSKVLVCLGKVTFDGFIGIWAILRSLMFHKSCY